jgi:hypothetical protein
MTQWIVVFGTIAAATSAWALAEWRRSRMLWTIGAVLATIHSAAAFKVFHGWSHDAALVATARQTLAVTGIDWGGGLYFNYAFVGVWLADALWWWIAPRSHESRPPVIGAVVRGFLFFMFLNGAVIFADGWMRVLGILSVGLVSIAWLKSYFMPARLARP